MRYPRKAGILLHPTSIPGRFGIGDLGESAYRFVDFLASSGLKLWQVLPLGPTGYADSPYASFSSFAGNPLLVNLLWLASDGDVDQKDLQDAPNFPDDHVDYGSVIDFKTAILQRAARTFRKNASAKRLAQFKRFCAENAAWLDDYALFMALKEAHGGAVWNTWEWELVTRDPEALEAWRERLDENVYTHLYAQYQFFHQWKELRQYANNKGIQIIGDIPIFVAYDSVDVWAHPELYYLDNDRLPSVVAGVPPDYFSETGQLWGNPLYRWNRMAKNGFAWWVERIKQNLKLVDILRIDHFRGFEAYWEIPAGEPTAINGRWVKGPGEKLFYALQNELGEDLPIIAEDLGVITPPVIALREQFGFPGMKVLQFAFDSDATNPDLPFNHDHNRVVYTGTHDNDTTLGWYKSRSDKIKHKARLYMGVDGHDISWDMIRMAFASVSDMAVVPLQDVLGLGTEARMNHPGVESGNWQWRYWPSALDDEFMINRLRMLVDLYGREGWVRDETGNLGEWMKGVEAPEPAEPAD